MHYKKLSLHILQSILIVIITFTLNSCGGGGSTSDSPTSPSPIVPEIPTLVVEYFSPVAQDNSSITYDCDDTVTDSQAVFTDVSKSVGLCYTALSSSDDSTASRVSGGIAVSDFNQDRRLDIYVTQGRNSSGRLFSLQADSHFLEVKEEAGITTNSSENGALFFDINYDSLPDLISVQDGPTYLQVFANNGNGTFSEITDSTGITLTKPSFTIAAGDHDLDGDLDLFFAHWAPYEKQSRWEFLWQNQGDATFIDISNTIELGYFPADDGLTELEDNYDYTFTPIFADVNNDRYPDILLSSDFSFSQILINDAGTGYNDFTPNAVNDRAGMGAAVADYDNDGDLDWFVTSIGDTREEFLYNGLFDGNRLYKNDGSGNFSNVTDDAGVRQGFWAWGSCFADFNSDGFEDLLVVNGFDGMTESQSVSRSYESFNNDPALLYINNGDGTFTDKATELGVTHTAMGRGLVCYDYDRDGDLDMIIANSGAAPTLYRNNSFSGNNNFLNVQLIGTEKNPHAVGARIYVSTADNEQMRELQLGNNYISQNPVEAHFGLGTSETVLKLKIVWPGIEAIVSELNNIAVNQFLVIHQPDS